MNKEQTRLLRYVAPYYRSARQAKEEGQFFQKLLLLWVDRFPEAKNGTGDLEYAEFMEKKLIQVRVLHFVNSLDLLSVTEVSSIFILGIMVSKWRQFS